MCFKYVNKCLNIPSEWLGLRELQQSGAKSSHVFRGIPSGGPSLRVAGRPQGAPVGVHPVKLPCRASGGGRRPFPQLLLLRDGPFRVGFQRVSADQHSLHSGWINVNRTVTGQKPPMKSPPDKSPLTIIPLGLLKKLLWNMPVTLTCSD